MPKLRNPCPDHLWDAYADFVMEHNDGVRAICNGDTLLDAMEDGYLYEEFLRSRKGSQPKKKVKRYRPYSPNGEDYDPWLDDVTYGERW